MQVVKKPRQKDLVDMLRRTKQRPYVGATTVPEKRRREHARRFGNRATMYIARSKNMKQSEQKLLNTCKQCRNMQKKSNMRENKKGYTYVVLQKRKRK
ncbi:hypothetical protein BaRGS_00039775 [Batillaria attramentaria]|uniref:Uncharacterized protein n=1 Tax=Batillaria attramentaria TaxID=370345 RepID=A0ABD0J2B4_9CAEN